MNNRVICCPIAFATPDMNEALALRTEILRKPLHLEFKSEDISEEWDSYHLGAFLSNGFVVGVLILKPIEERVKMRQVAIHSDFQKKGIGVKLVQYSESFARHFGFTKIELHARLSAVPFYQKLNYKIKGKMFKEVGLDHYFMEKNLK
ncbi:MAG: GNAT family N-acetyltransferase [Saprospiraceae bacterium]|nr:GNAT family N-acetyltransferase [Saprospiraceae bacterium]MBK6565735.1 GNAT family N-acetyltransferase [Saprospiraceae bacterium]MBK6784621.1 GNAT family N-acetyltransferase [Saprospiraceae bacterium]MBK7525229.1 GNAT family N-acetyltransferase [Saprospiraceae bacterium]MBK8082155.1 GNAT family N-acetyltransferase [Saprospiraceae bacterium]